MPTTPHETADRDELAFKVSGKVELIEVVLVSATLSRADRPDAETSFAVDLARSTSFKLETVNELRVDSTLRFSAKDLKRKVQANVVEVVATFALTYRLSDTSELSDEHYRAFAELNGTFNAWPYFREFLQTATTRMGFPPFTLPVLRVGATAPE